LEVQTKLFIIQQIDHHLKLHVNLFSKENVLSNKILVIKQKCININQRIQLMSTA